MANLVDTSAQSSPSDGGRVLPPTPVVKVTVSVDGLPRNLWLKLESHSPHGSVKGRTALALWEDIAGRVDPGIGIIESTSGNLGLALAAVTASHGVPFTAVVDPRSSASVVAGVRALGGRVVTIDRPDGSGGYLLSRIAYIRERLRTEPRLVWPDQYANPASPRVHARGTAPELWAQTMGRPMSVLVAVSTGGTLAGFRDYAAAARPAWELVGVDVAGSAALGAPPARGCSPASGRAGPPHSCPRDTGPPCRSAPVSRSVPACGCPRPPAWGWAAVRAR